MKFLFLVVSLSLLALGTAAQTVSPDPPVAVLEQKWRLNRLDSVNPALNEDPMEANREANRSQQESRETLESNRVLQKQNKPLEAPRQPVRVGEDARPPEPGASFVYQIRVRNDAGLKIRKIVWDYVFLDRASKEEVGRHSFESKTGIKPGMTGKLAHRLPVPPARVVKAGDAAGQKAGEQYEEKIVIRRVEYEDGTVWPAAQ